MFYTFVQSATSSGQLWRAWNGNDMKWQILLES
jgi:hypothetical protein